MADKYLSLNATTGLATEVEATVTSAGAGDAGEIPALDAAGKLDTTVMPSGVGAQTKTLEASETLSAGDLVNVWDDTGTTKARKADATTVGKSADGFVLAGIASAASGTVYLSGTITGLSGLTGGTRYFLHTTAGATTATPPSGSGNTVQSVGRALSATEIAFQPYAPIVLA